MGGASVSEVPRIYPIVLAAGRSVPLGFLRPLARFGRKTALEIAVENCRGLERPIVVLGHQARRLRRAVPPSVRVIVNRNWRAGQLSSLRAELRHVPRNAAFLLYPVDYPLLTRSVVGRLVAAFKSRSRRHAIVVPIFERRHGHPVLFSPGTREELRRAHTAKEVVFRNPKRVRFVGVGTSAIWEDFDTPGSYRRILHKLLRRHPAGKKPSPARGTQKSS